MWKSRGIVLLGGRVGGTAPSPRDLPAPAPAPLLFLETAAHATGWRSPGLKNILQVSQHQTHLVELITIIKNVIRSEVK
jgi:hypothetical protein